MPEHVSARTIGDLLDEGVISATAGFPYGGHAAVQAGVTHVRPFNVTALGDISLDQIKAVPEDIALARPRLALNDIVFNNTNTKELVGKCAVWSHASEPAFSNHMTRIRILDGSCHSDYLALALLHHWLDGRSEMLARAHVAQASIIGQRFREIALAWPDPTTQAGIAAAIGLVRRALRSESMAIHGSARLKKAAMRELFTRGQRGDEQKDTEVGPTPASWDVEAIGEHFVLSSGGTPSRANPAFWINGTIPWVKTGEVDYRLIERTEECITKEGLRNSAAKLLQPGTLLMAMYGQGKTRGKVATLGIEACCNQACAAFHPRDAAVAVRFLYHYLAYSYDALRRYSHGGQQQNLNMDIVKAFRIAYPRDADEQHEIVSILDAIDLKIDIHNRKRVLLVALFKSLLHKLMTGEIRVSDLNLSALDQQKAAQVSAWAL